MEWLEAIDRNLVFAINSLHTPWLDELMWIVSGKIIWIPFYLLLLFWAYKRYGVWKTGLFLVSVVLAIALADLISVHAFKNVFERYRPSHHADLTDRLHFYKMTNGELYKGGQFGFVSSHAANFAAICGFTWLAVTRNNRNRSLLLLLVFVLVCFSRIYLGVHYASDLLVGGLVGLAVAYAIYASLWRGVTGKK